MAIVYNANNVAGKLCTNCSQWKPLAEYSRRMEHGLPTGDGFQSACKKCRSIAELARYRANPEPIRAANRARHAARREQRLAAMHVYRATNREKILAQKRAHWAANRERINAERRAQHATNPEPQRAADRAYYASNREKRIAYGRAYRAANPDKIRALNHAYRLSFPDKIRAITNRRRTRKAQAEGSHTEAEWEALKAFYNYTCLRCGKREPEVALTRDHVVPLSQGGSDWITNLQPLCPICNSTKNEKIIDYRTYWPLAPDISAETLEDQ